ncbi:dCMP deaminase family protein [bacterium]|nr:dCMP deaminase family protein [bacterium]
MNTNKRISKDEYYLNIAKAVSLRSTCIRRNYGVVIVKNDEIISTGYNGSPRGEVNCCDTYECIRNKLNTPKGERYELCVAIHAEDNAIMSAGREKCNGATLYIVGTDRLTNDYADPQPCLMCRRKIINAGISRVVGMVNGEVKDLNVQNNNL